MYRDYKSFSIGERVKVRKFLKYVTGVIIETQDPVYRQGIMIMGQNVRVRWDNLELGETDWLPANQFEEA